MALVAVVAFLLGSFGTATAAGITKSQVKKIAKKVVHKEAPKLSVAHAASADTATNATSLNGRPASAYQSPALSFRLPVGGAAATTKSYTLNGVPAGNYQFAYTVFGLSAGQVACYLQTGGATSIAEGYNGGSDSSFSTPSGSGVVNVTSTAPMLTCYGTSANTFTLLNSTQFVSTISMTRIDDITSGTVTAARSDGTGVRPSN
ncbi:MAG TPA: hypothetical protein VFV89_16400 [Nocardioides sp.]|nr:hypothetical protein [Nocardioides sp.]